MKVESCEGVLPELFLLATNILLEGRRRQHRSKSLCDINGSRNPILLPDGCHSGRLNANGDIVLVILSDLLDNIRCEMGRVLFHHHCVFG